MAYRALALATLLAEVNALYTKRSKASDGWIGDAAHSARDSDHNPDDSGMVRAQDIDENLDGITSSNRVGYANALVDQIIADPRVAYAIYEGRIWQNPAVFARSGWLPYSGVNAHAHHIHVSVRRGAQWDSDPSPWNIKEVAMAMPVVTSKYGWRTFTLNGKKITNFHKGGDLRSPLGAAVTSAFSGTVIKTATGRTKGAPVGKAQNGVAPLAETLSGNGVLIRLSDNSIYVEAHLTPSVKVGDKVVAGKTVLGKTDVSGQITAPHRHTERWYKNLSSTHYDPIPQLKAAYSDLAKPAKTPEQLEEEELMGALDEFKKALTESEARTHKYMDAVRDQLAGWTEDERRALLAWTAAGRKDPVGTEVGNLMIKAARHDVQEIHFKTSPQGKWAVAWVGTGTWAICPDDATWVAHNGVLDHLKLSNTLAVRTWEQVSGAAGSMVKNPLAFGRQVSWSTVTQAPVGGTKPQETL